MKLQKWLCSVCLFLLLVAPVPSFGGMAVIDYSNLMQAITEYTQMLDDSSELVSQTGVLDAQYLQQVEDYMQTLREYEHYLNQVTGFSHYLTNADWQDLLRQSVSYYGENGFSGIADIRVNTSQGQVQLDNLIRETMGLLHIDPEDPTVSSSRMSNLHVSGDDLDAFGLNATKTYANIKAYEDLQRIVAANETEAAKRKLITEKLGDKLKDLGDESDLATLQLMASQNQIVHDQNEAELRVLNQILQRQGEFSLYMDSREAAGREREVERLERVTADKCDVYGSSRWGDL